MSLTDEDLAPLLSKTDMADARMPIVQFAAKVLPLWPVQARILADFYRSGARIGCFNLGRRSGKGRMAAIVAAFESVVDAPLHRASLAPGELATVAVVATSERQAGIVHGMISSLFEHPALRPLVESHTSDELVLTTGVRIMTLPASARGARGLACAVVVFDEMAHMLDSTGSDQAARAMWSALVPATGTFPAGKVLALSTPNLAAGPFYELVEKATSGEHGDLFYSGLATWQVNPMPNLRPFLRNEQARDPAMFDREYGACWDSGVGAALDAETIRAAVVERGDLKPRPGLRYIGSFDPSYRRDNAALIVGHAEDRRLVLDLVRSWRPRGRALDHSTLLADVAGIAKSYGAVIVSDQFALDAWQAGLRERGITLVGRPWTAESKIAAVERLRQRLFEGTLELPDNPDLVRELTLLERHPLPSGRVRIAGGAGTFDDLAMALLGLVAEIGVAVLPLASVAIEPTPGAYFAERRLATLFHKPLVGGHEAFTRMRFWVPAASYEDPDVPS